MAVGPSGGIKNEINVTPLVDVVLVLLIIFMVITPMLQRGKDVHLPKAEMKENKDEKKEADPLVVSITLDKALWIETETVGEDAFEEGIRAELTRQPGRKILVK